ncbi:MAG: hypothetical protein DWQ35_11445 [Planctomycetota bacterium]|nr:MAG: hypothetical protein DWQ35_11445 [Planctomycetota bacterium]
MEDSHYVGREQSEVKHLILQEYLLPFALIIGRGHGSITYVDCFSGPWESASTTHEDTSFSIAIGQLKKARARLKRDGIQLDLRAFFIEKDRNAFRRLQQYAQKIRGVEINVRNAELEESIDDICCFVREANRTFPFVFIDPTGWKGFELDVIRPILTLRPCEVLINFMTHYIVRFANNEESKESFERLFGSDDFYNRLQGTQGSDRVDEAVFEYRDAVSKVGNFDYAGIAGILNPIRDRSHFHLLYFSRHPRGLEKFKEAERRSMGEMEQLRARAQKSGREQRSQQREFLYADEAPDSTYYLSLRERYLGFAKADVIRLLQAADRVTYDDAWNAWLRYPMVWEKDLKDWVRESSKIALDGLGKRERVPKLGRNHFLRFAGIA